jgi:hypothetical protein
MSSSYGIRVEDQKLVVVREVLAVEVEVVSVRF